MCMRARLEGTCSLHACSRMHACTGLICRQRGGLEEERAERQRFKDAEAATRQRNFEWLQELRRSGFQKVGLGNG